MDLKYNLFKGMIYGTWANLWIYGSIPVALNSDYPI